jgi:hypothetical protein
MMMSYLLFSASKAEVDWVLVLAFLAIEVPAPAALIFFDG